MAQEQPWDRPLEELQEEAVERLSSRPRQLLQWVEDRRPADGPRGRFTWARQTTRQANVAATAYILGGLRGMGLTDEVITDADREEGAAWVGSMNTDGAQYRDPALVERRSPDWPEDEAWPSAGMMEGLNQYSLNVLHGYTPAQPKPQRDPPPGWPQADDAETTALEWITTRPWYTNPWGACSHMMRMGTYLLRWHEEGRVSLDPLVEAIRFWYHIQDPMDGLWGGPRAPAQHRINGTFKLFPLLMEQLDMPLPFADRILDEVLAQFERPDYDETVGACDEWDNWYVIALALPKAGGHRAEEIARLAAWRARRNLELFGQEDGGFSYHPGRCQTTWIGFDMAPDMAQGDAMGPGILAPAVNCCVDLAGLQERTPWTGRWRMREANRADPTVRSEILQRVFETEEM